MNLIAFIFSDDPKSTRNQGNLSPVADMYKSDRPLTLPSTAYLRSLKDGRFINKSANLILIIPQNIKKS